jgi:predicted enzyme related to lactoylglutathione lyase
MPHSQPTPGQFIWHNLVTNGPDAAVAFYGRLFGWTTRDLHIGGVYAATTFRSGEHDVGGLVRAGSGSSQWLPFLAVGDVEGALSEATRLGGRVMPPPADLSGVISLSFVLDPTGASFIPAAAAGSANQLADAAMPGRFCWSELLTTDAARAAAFYGALAGWTTSEWDLGGERRYWLFRRADRDVAGMIQLPDGDGRPSCWLPYVQVVSAEETAALAAELGGAVVTPPGDVPGRGRSAVVEDPGGARVAVFALTVAA